MARKTSNKTATVAAPSSPIQGILQATLDALALDVEKKKISTNHINLPSRIRKAGSKAKADPALTQKAVELYLATCVLYVYGKNDGRLNRLEELKFAIECSTLSPKELNKLKAEGDKAFTSSLGGEDEDEGGEE